MQNSLTIFGELGHTTTMMTVNSHRAVHLLVRVGLTPDGIDEKEVQAMRMIAASVAGFVGGALLCTSLWSEDETGVKHMEVRYPSLVYAIPQSLLFVCHDIFLVRTQQPESEQRGTSQDLPERNERKDVGDHDSLRQKRRAFDAASPQSGN